MATLLNRGLSAAVAITYLTAVSFHGSGLDVAIVAVALLLPLTCIWFSDAMGESTGMINLVPSASTPGVFVCAAGWFLLLGLPLILYFVMRPSGSA